MHKPSGLQIGPSQWAAASRAPPLHTRTGLREHTFRDFEHGAWEDDGGLLVALSGSPRWRRLRPLLSMFQTPKLSRSLCLLGRSQRRGEKSKKNTDLWEVNCHSGPVEKAVAIFTPLPSQSCASRDARGSDGFRSFGNGLPSTQ
jgi:hypothetical protein